MSFAKSRREREHKLMPDAVAFDYERVKARFSTGPDSAALT